MGKEFTRREILAMGLKGIGLGLAVQTLPRNLLADTEVENSPQDRKYNVLFIAVDDLRPQLNCYGHEQMISPNIDRLSENGTLFERAYCQQAVCAPSRASLLAGCRPDTTGVHDLNTPLRSVMPDVTTLPQYFKNNGYHSISLGKIYHHRSKDDPQAWSEKAWGPRRTFPGYVSQEVEELRKRLWEESGREGHLYQVKGPAVEAADVPDDAYADGQLALKAMETMSRLRDKPFFLAVGFHKPHLAFACPKKYWDMYQREDIDLADNPFKPKDAPEIAMHNWGELRAYYGIPRKGRLTDEQARELVHGYYACVSFIDVQIGRLLDELERLDLRDNTIVILWGDHGWNLREHGLWCKHSNFETSVRSPLIISVPKQKSAGQKTKALVEFVDIYPSLCELCGLPLPDHLEGLSFAPLLENPHRPWKKAAFSQYPRGKAMGYSMRTDRYRYTEWGKGAGAGVELYDHYTDPGENINIAMSPENSQLVRELRKMLRAGWPEALPE